MKKLNKRAILFFYTMVSLFFFGLLIKFEYATDTYAVFNFDKNAIFMQYAMSGRYVTAIIGLLIKVLKLSEFTIYRFSYILSIVCIVISQYKLYTIIEKDVENKVLKTIIPTLVIINPFSMELSLYIEKGIMWLGVLMCICALKNLICFFETNKKKKIIIAIIYMFIANCSYQGIVGIFISIALVYILKYSNNLKQFVINNLFVGTIYSIPALLDLFLVKVFLKSSRIDGKINYIKSLSKIFKNTISMFVKTYNLLPKYVFILLILFTFTLFCCKIWEEKKHLHILSFIYIVIGILFFAIAPQIIQPTDSIWFVPRVTYSFASMYGILILYLATNYDVERLTKKTIIVLSVVLILFQLQKFIRIENDRFLLNKKDEEVTMKIIKQINDYEKQTGNIITQVSIYQDKNPNYTYNGIFATGDMNIKCYFTDWSAIEVLKYYSKKDLKLVEKDVFLDKQFKQKNWDEFNLNQIVFKENTINICNY